jgi:hypothetical protein
MVLGKLSKMHTSLSETQVNYKLQLDSVWYDLNSLVGKKIKLSYTGKIVCTSCHKQIKKSYAQGFCYPCTMKLASCDLCILKPETCHFHQGTCREPEWGEKNCFQSHYVYLANSSGLKVGITRKTNVPYRWMDQGATEALPILEVSNRLVSGQVEVLFKKLISDKTDWRKMLRGEPESLHLPQWRDKLFLELKEELKSFNYNLLDDKIFKFKYPVESYPEKISSLSLDKISQIDGKILGIKGQYLIFDCGVLNVRSHTGYEIMLET